MQADKPAIVVIEHAGSEIATIVQRIVRYAGDHADIVTLRDTPYLLAEIAERPVPLLLVGDSVPTDVVLLLAQELRALSRQTRIVQALSERTEDVERHATAAGVGLLPSPFPYGALEQLVHEALEA